MYKYKRLCQIHVKGTFKAIKNNILCNKTDNQKTLSTLS